MAKRKAMSQKTRFEVFKRDGFVCQYCGSHPPAAILHVDHIVPVAGGGENDMDNLVTSCSVCNSGKGANSLEAVPQGLADRAKVVKEQEAQLRGYHDVIASRRTRIDDQSWQVAEVFMDAYGKTDILKVNRQSIKQFLEKLDVHELIEAMEIATAKKPYSEHTGWKYFCGICWTKIKRAAEGANA
jgi:hypothetical protein